MSEESKPPRYMAQLLEELGWNQGTRIPLADPKNQELENLLITRQTEIQRLKEALALQKQKRNDLNNYMQHVNSEHQENTRLLFAHKQQMEQELKLKQMATNEADRLEKDINESTKVNKDVSNRLDRLQRSIGRLLKKADALKTEVIGERGALQEWRAALDRSAGDISAIEQFTKQDVSKAKALEYKRQKLKVEHDRMQERLNQLVSNLSAEERGCERISVQVIDSMDQRKQMLNMWAGAVENLRQRDTDIRHIREDYAVLEDESNRVADQCREQQNFFDQQKGNNEEAIRSNMALAQELSNIRLSNRQIIEENVSLDSEAKSLQRELSKMHKILEHLHMENRQIMEEQHKKDMALHELGEKLAELKEKLVDSLDRSKSSEKRAKELEDILNEEERYANQVTLNQQRAMHCSFVEQQKLLALKNEEKLFHMQLKACKAIMSKLDNKQREIEKNLQSQKETLYGICYQLETIGAQVSHMEGAQAERECSSELVEKEKRLKEVANRHAARFTLLERHSARLYDDMRRLSRELEAKTAENAKQQSHLKSSMLRVEGGEKEVRASRGVWRRMRVEEALMRLRVAHAARALAGLDDTAFTLDKQRLQLDAAMSERLIEIGARRDMFNVQKRSLLEDCGKLNSEIKEREQRIDQLKKRYDIFIASLGKDDSGQQLSVTFFKIKFAAERAELRMRGATLDAEVSKCERDVAALEATLRVVHAAHKHFLHHISPLSEDAPEIEELNALTKEYYEKRDVLKVLLNEVVNAERAVAEASSKLTGLNDKLKLLTAREAENENELEGARERVAKQESRLNNAREIVKYNAKRAQKLVEGVDDWRIFQLSIWVRDYAEAAASALQSLVDTCSGSPAADHLAALLSGSDLVRFLPKHQRRIQVFIQKYITETINKDVVTVEEEVKDESVFSTLSSSEKSGVSLASGHTKRLSAFRKHLAPKVQEPALIDAIPETARRSTVSLRVITLGLEESVSATAPFSMTAMSSRSRKFQ